MKLILLVASIFFSFLAQAEPGEFTCTTIKKDDGEAIQKQLSENCSTSRPFSVTTNKEGSSVICCIGKQQ